MAEFMIKAIDAKHSDPIKDQAGCYKRGDVVQVYKDGRCNEPPSPNSKMMIIKIPGLSLMDAQKYMESEEEAQETTREWNQFDWDVAVAGNSFGEFISKPILESTKDVSTSKTVSAIGWAKMLFENNYYPFVAKPTAKEVLTFPSSYQLTGTVRTVTLRGDIMVVITRRKHSFGIDNLPSETKTKLKSQEIVTLSKAQADAVLLEKTKVVA